MGLYNFQKRFVPKVLAGEKTHTIRAIRANPDKPGNVLHLYTGLRTKAAKLLMRVPCVKVEEIEIYLEPPLPNFGPVLTRGLRFPGVTIDGVKLSDDEKESLARRDGFDSFAQMLEFWEGRFPFRGHIIHWRSEVA